MACRGSQHARAALRHSEAGSPQRRVAQDTVATVARRPQRPRSRRAAQDTVVAAERFPGHSPRHLALACSPRRRIMGGTSSTEQRVQLPGSTSWNFQEMTRLIRRELDESAGEDEEGHRKASTSETKTLDSQASAPTSVTRRDCGECAICLTADGYQRAELPCQHRFHVQCLLGWSKSGQRVRTCPLCRREFNGIKVIRVRNMIVRPLTGGA